MQKIAQKYDESAINRRVKPGCGITRSFSPDEVQCTKEVPLRVFGASEYSCEGVGRVYTFGN